MANKQKQKQKEQNKKVKVAAAAAVVATSAASTETDYLSNTVGMSENGTLKQMGDNVKEFVAYIDALITGKGKASSTGEHLGNNFFVNTKRQCKNSKNLNELKDRYIYVNNIPSGSVPSIFPESMEVSLIPGLMSNLNELNPGSLLNAFFAGTNPVCQEITMETIDTNNKKSSETHYVALTDIRQLNPCLFAGGKNPVSGNTCLNGFTNINQKIDTDNYEHIYMNSIIPDDLFGKMYAGALGCIGIYITYRAMVRLKLVPEIQ